MMLQNDVRFHLKGNAKRNYEIMVFSDRVLLKGKYWYLRNKEFYKGKGSDFGRIDEYIGMGYIKKHSYKKGIAFVVFGMLLGSFGTIARYIGKAVERWYELSATSEVESVFPEILNVTFKGLLIVCVLVGCMYLFSWRHVIEISFLSKRFCVPKGSMTSMEFASLREAILESKERSV